MNESEQNLLAAFNNYTPPKFEHTYRIYYDPRNGHCLYTSVELHDRPHIVVDQETYKTLPIMQYVVHKGKLKPKRIEFTHTKPLVYDEQGQYKTIKGAAMFLVDDNYTGPTSSWTMNYDS
jgi:hypothetical protein